jgi:hypothetical protein
MVKRLEVELNPLGKFLEERKFLMKTDLSLAEGSLDFRTIDYDCDDGCDNCDNVCDCDDRYDWVRETGKAIKYD